MFTESGNCLCVWYVFQSCSEFIFYIDSVRGHVKRRTGSFNVFSGIAIEDASSDLQ